jgi:hypothetical protein
MAGPLRSPHATLGRAESVTGTEPVVGCRVVGLVRKYIVCPFKQSLEPIGHELQVHAPGIVENIDDDRRGGSNCAFQRHVAYIDGICRVVQGNSKDRQNENGLRRRSTPKQKPPHGQLLFQLEKDDSSLNLCNSQVPPNFAKAGGLQIYATWGGSISQLIADLHQFDCFVSGAKPKDPVHIKPGFCHDSRAACGQTVLHGSKM